MAYVYRHIRLDKNEPFYIGVSLVDDEKYKRANSKTSRNKSWWGIVNRSRYRVDIILENLSNTEAFEKEKEFIALYKRKNLGGTLVNLTDGGEGSIGKIVTDINKKKMSVLQKTDQKLVEHRKRISQAKIKKVSVLNLEDNVETVFENSMEAANYLSIRKSTISGIINGKIKPLSGYKLSYVGEAHKEYKEKVKKIGRKRAVNMYDKEGNFIKHFESVRSTEKDGFNSASVSAICLKNNGNWKYHKNYHFTFA